MIPPIPQLPIVEGSLALGTGCAALLWLLLRETPQAPTTFCGDGPLKAAVLPQCRTLVQPFRPTPWASNTHFQTVLGLLRKASLHKTYQRQLAICSDGGTIALDWFDGCDTDNKAARTAPVVLIMHGINGGSHEGYCKWACASAVARGWRAVVLNYRGCNGLTLTSPRAYTATATSDVQIALESIRGRFPGAPVFVAAYSLGSVILTKFLAEADSGLHGVPVYGAVRKGHATGGSTVSGFCAAAMVSSPVCLSNSLANLSKPWTMTFLYNLALAFKLREFITEHSAIIRRQAVIDMDAAMRAWTVQEVEDSGVARAYGFRSRQDYYEQGSSLSYLPAIRTPTLLLMAQDDPFLGVIPDQECSSNPSTLLAVTRRGGHLGFTQGLWPLGFSYMDDAVMEFFQVVLDQQAALEALPPAAAVVVQRPAIIALRQPDGDAFAAAVAGGGDTQQQQWNRDAFAAAADISGEPSYAAVKVPGTFPEPERLQGSDTCAAAAAAAAAGEPSYAAVPGTLLELSPQPVLSTEQEAEVMLRHNPEPYMVQEEHAEGRAEGLDYATNPVEGPSAPTAGTVLGAGDPGMSSASSSAAAEAGRSHRFESGGAATQLDVAGGAGQTARRAQQPGGGAEAAGSRAAAAAMSQEEQGVATGAPSSAEFDRPTNAARETDESEQQQLSHEQPAWLSVHDPPSSSTDVLKREAPRAAAQETEGTSNVFGSSRQQQQQQQQRQVQQGGGEGHALLAQPVSPGSGQCDDDYSAAQQQQQQQQGYVHSAALFDGRGPAVRSKL